MHCGVITLFPEMFQAIQQEGITGRALKTGLLSLTTWNLRDFSTDKHATVDDRPYGGGPGMVLMAAPLRAAIGAAKKAQPTAKVVYVTPAGKRFDHSMARSFATVRTPLLFIAGRYEGIDERVIANDVDQLISIGDYVLSGGELAVMVIIDALTRWLPGALGHDDSAPLDAFSEENLGLLDCPHYSRPATLEGQSVPPVLLTGDHKAIALWRKKQALYQTWIHRPDLLKKRVLTAIQKTWLTEFQQTHAKEPSL
jgi:tRNA (guanine37-N1)-methyltransferase